MKTILSFFAALLTITSGFAIDITANKAFSAKRTTLPIKIDGELNDIAWDQAEVLTDFIQNEPNPGMPASQPTEVRMLYDDEALYISAYMHDVSADSVLHQLTQRDDLGNTDFFGFYISCFQDGINAFYFLATPDGVQYDAQLSAFGEDSNWNAVWQCNTSITEDGWIAEFKIPYSALRFPDKEEQKWDINFLRNIRRLREMSHWEFVNPEIQGWVNQSGQVNGISDIKPPVRLFFYPYASAYAEVQKMDDGTTSTRSSFNGGMDIKFGINEAFTLDMTLIPDFGQVRSDNLILNLGPFELFLEEQRPFFTEGIELFNKAGLFYSRRIGGFPVNYDRAYDEARTHEIVESNPYETQLVNSTKISGRNAKGLGVGFFNSVTSQTSATLRDTLTGEARDIVTAPITNYNILVFDQNLGNNSYISLINTNVTRAGETYDANVTGTEFDLRNDDNSISITGEGAYSKKFNFGDSEKDNGYRYSVGVSKISGQLNFGASTEAVTKYYDHNDLGFQLFPNYISNNAWLSYNIFEPFGKFNRMWSYFETNYNHLKEPNVFTGADYYGEVGFSTRGFHAFGIETSGEPGKQVDYFESRRDGWFFNRPETYQIGGWISTDYRKKLAFDIGSWYTEANTNDWHILNFRVSPRFRFSDKLMFIYVYSTGNRFNEIGYTSTADDDRIIFGSRDVTFHTNLATVNYIFSNRMGLTFRLRHYWSTVKYDRFMELQEDGNTYGAIANWNGDDEELGFVLDDAGTERVRSTQDRSFNTFNIDMVYTWVFSPGSEISVVWKQSIINDDNLIPTNFGTNLDRTISLPQNNSFSIRVLYFIDYLNFTRKGKFIEN